MILPFLLAGPAKVLALALAVTAPLFAQNVVQNWTFNDAGGTALTATTNTGSLASPWTVNDLSPNLGALTTDGMGSLVIGDFNFTPAQVALARLNGDVGFSTGVLTVDVVVTSWSFGSQRPQFFVSLLNAEGDIVAGMIFDIGTLIAFVGGVSDTGIDMPGDDDLRLPKTLTTPHLFRLVVDFAANSYQLLAAPVGAPLEQVGLNMIADPSLDLDRTAFNLEFYARYNTTGTSTRLDQITVTHSASPGGLTPIQSWRNGYFSSTEPLGEAADDADPDGDGIPNLIEYATGTDPTVASPAPINLGRNAEGFLTLAFTSIADPALTYRVLGSDTLAPDSWAPVFSETGATLGAGPQLVTDDKPFTAQPSRFLRLSVTR